MNLKNLYKQDYIITACILLLLSIGLVIIYSTTFNTTIEAYGAGSVPRQILFIILGIVIYFGVSLINIDWFKQPVIIGVIYAVTVAMLVYLILFGQVIANTKRWIDFGFINLQPSEIAKITIIIVSSYILSRISKEYHNKKWKDTNIENQSVKKRFLDFAFSKAVLSFIAILPILLLVFIQPALGNTIILFSIWFSIWFLTLKKQAEVLSFSLIMLLTSINVYGIFTLTAFAIADNQIILAIILIGVITGTYFLVKMKIKYMFVAVLIGFIIVPVFNFGWNNILADYHRSRVENFIQGPESDIYGAGYQVIQSINALGSGQLTGRGLLQGTQSSLRILDFAHTDFIFAATGEQLGFLSNSIILLIYLVMILRIIEIAKTSNSEFESLLATGVGMMILLNMFINTGMNMGILPVTGVPLPLVSYGGSSILINLVGLGLVQSVKIHNKSIDTKDSLLVL